ncbi:MAG: hypothetical protein DMF56_22170 [Acidobacteria bacterium]|nr:MAG: hypothetical protein DMF56_22170 [Acidobacteriota bacterium]
MRPERSLTALQDSYDGGERNFRDLQLLGKAVHGRRFDDCVFEFVTFDEIELLDVVFERCTFRALSFRRARFYDGVRFANCTFDHVEFESADLRAGIFADCTFTFTRFTAANIAAVTFELCVFSDSAVMTTSAQMQRWEGYQYFSISDADAEGLRMFASAQMNGTRYDRCNFEGSSLTDTRLRSVTFINSQFKFARAVRTRWEQVSCEASDFVHVSFDTATILAVTFSECTFTRASFVAAELEQTAFHGCFMDQSNVSRARLLATDLTPFCDSRKTLRLSDPPVIDWRSVCRSIKSPTLHLLLLAFGMPDIIVHYLIDAARAVDPDMLFKMMRSTFISYGTPDREFAAALREILEQNGVRTFFFEKDAVPGERLHRVMHEGVNKYDRVILICSEASLIRPGVKNEIEETLAREARDGGASYLIPIARDDFVFEWKDALGYRIRDRVVADFTRATPGSDEFKTALQKLLTALRTDPTVASGA